MWSASAVLVVEDTEGKKKDKIFTLVEFAVYYEFMFNIKG